MNERNQMLETGDIKKTLFKLSLPAIIGLLVSALYNIIDGIFIGKGAGPLAFGALTVAFPIQMVLTAVAQMVGMGASSVYSRALGEKDYEKAETVVGNAFLSNIVLGILMVSIGLMFIDPILLLFGATTEIMPYAKDYVSIILLGSLFNQFAMSTNSLIRAEGNAKAAMFTMLVGAVLNTILDPIFIFGFNMGIEGAAIATSLSQFFSFLFVIYYLKGDKTNMKPKAHHFKPHTNILNQIFSIGFSSFARQIASSFVAILLNHSLKIYGGNDAFAIYGAAFKILMFLMMPLFGIVQGVQPLIGYNYGARQMDRVNKSIKYAIIATTVFATTSVVFGMIFPKQLMSLFLNDPKLIDQSASALRIILICMPVIGIQSVGGSVYQSIGKVIPALVLSALRQVILFAPLLIILPSIITPSILGVWITFPMSDGISTIITGIMLKKEMNTMAKQNG
ncbi:MATE family efflux transporter [Tepidibacter mesophilus]|uniref:MATE family efflux transporter n=1 Tax=Tepidibacter mesophilus TaxID=655607 RepID=UPI000C07E220|nr:MATE family efflux transporter [Tepidibacter mesophilus]